MVVKVPKVGGSENPDASVVYGESSLQLLVHVYIYIYILLWSASYPLLTLQPGRPGDEPRWYQ